MSTDTVPLGPGPTPPPPAPPASTRPAATVSSTSASTGASATPAPIARPLLVAGALLQLAALGVVGPFVLGTLTTLLGLGFGLLLVVGIGILFLVAFVYALFALSWLETARVDGLYGFGLAPRRVRRSGRPGFGGLMRTLWQQTIDPNVWRAIANLAIATVLGWIVLALFGIAASGLVAAFSPFYATGANTVELSNLPFDVPLAWAAPIGVLSALLAAAALVGIGILHGFLSRAIMVPSREAQLAEEARTSGAQRVGAMRAADLERTRIERDLHDGVQPRLVSVGMTLGLAHQKIDDDPAAAKLLIAEAHTSTKAAITELRQLARGIHTSVLDDRGLDAALSALASRSHIPVALDVRLSERCSLEAETAVYFVIAESLTNAAKHSRAAECRVTVRQRDGGMLWARVDDNGIGGATVVPGGGLDGIANRVLGARGTFRLDSPVGGPTTVEVSVPCAS